MSIKPIALLFACIGGTISSLPASTTFIRNTMEFHHEDVIFRNTQADITLAGTLTAPNSKGPFPAALLIAGYGPNDRDVTGAGQKHFKVLAEYLTRQGIAVLRYDKRGVGQSTGEYNTTATTRDYADDARAGIEYLQTRNEIDPTKIGLIGLSEGGLIASMLTAECKAVAFTVLLAPALRSDGESWVEQSSLQLQADGASSEFIERDKSLRREIYALVTQETDLAVAEAKLQKAVAEYLTSLPEAQALE